MPFSTQEITWKMKPNTDASQLIRMTSIIQKHEETQEEVPLDSKRCNVLFIQFEHLTPAHGSLQEWIEAGNAAWGTRWPSCILPSMRGQCLHTSQTEVALTDLPAAPSLNKGSHSCPSHRPENNFLLLIFIIYIVHTLTGWQKRIEQETWWLCLSCCHCKSFSLSTLKWL